MRAAAIDTGTNSIKMVIGESDSAGIIRILHESSVNARLGEGLAFTDLMGAAGMERAMEAIGGHLESASQYKAARIRIVGTEAIRDADNGADFLRMVKDRFGVSIEIISGEDEARYAFLAATGDPELGAIDGPQVVTDTGGGSTEIILGVGARMKSRVSVRIGAVSITEKFLADSPVTEKALTDARSYIDGMIRRHLQGVEADRVICIGGSAVNLARIVYRVPPDQTQQIHASRLDTLAIRDLISRLAGMTLDEHKNIKGLEPQRADIILGGALIIERTLSIPGRDSMLVSIRGLRHAILFEMLTTGDG